MRLKPDDYAPLGVDYKRELKWTAYGLAAAFVYSLSFFIAYSKWYELLYTWDGTIKVLRPDAVMPDFMEILESSLVGFVIVAVCMLAMLIYHYAFHYQGSRSIYLMKRLPNRFELWRRCAALPAAAAICSLLVALVLLFVYFGLYMAITPKACLTPQQWQKIWNVLSGASL
jgi:hypothetical protein